MYMFTPSIHALSIVMFEGKDSVSVMEVSVSTGSEKMATARSPNIKNSHRPLTNVHLLPISLALSCVALTAV